LQAMRSFTCDGAGCANGQMKCEADPFFPLTIRSEPVPVAVDQLPSDLRNTKPLHFCTANLHWFRPNTLTEAQELKRLLTESATPAQVRVVVGNTARAIYSAETPRYFIDLAAIPELRVAERNDDGLRLGAAIPIQRLLELAQETIDTLPAEKTIGL